MQIHITADSARLVHVHDLNAFSIVSTLSVSELTSAVTAHGVGQVLPAGVHVMVDVAALRRLAGAEATPEWEKGLAGMLRYARSRGWTNDNDTAVRGHVERPV